MARLWESGTGSVDEANEDMSLQEQVSGSQNIHWERAISKGIVT
jgi:hypothetical protein